MQLSTTHAWAHRRSIQICTGRTLPHRDQRWARHCCTAYEPELVKRQWSSASSNHQGPRCCMMNEWRAGNGLWIGLCQVCACGGAQTRSSAMPVRATATQPRPAMATSWELSCQLSPLHCSWVATRLGKRASRFRSPMGGNSWVPRCR